MEEVLKVANSMGAWITAAPIVIIALVQVLLYYRQIYHAVDAVNLTRDQLSQAFRTGMVTSIGPVVAIFIIMVGLMSVIGAPMAWMRLAVIGAAPTELTAATLGADAMGVKFGGEDTTFRSWPYPGGPWPSTVSAGCCWLASSPTSWRTSVKRSGGDTKWLGILSTAAMIGVFGYLNGRNIVAMGGPLIAAVTGGICNGHPASNREKTSQIKDTPWA